MYNCKRKSIFVALIMAFLLFDGCQIAPEKEVVVSKNSDLFDIDNAVAAEGTQSSTETQEVDFTSTFESTDKSVHFVMDISQAVLNTEMPLVQVTPHFLTEADAERTAYAIFPDAEFYEAEPLVNPTLSKSEIQEKISLWSQYTSVDALRTLYGDSYGDDYLTSTANLIKTFIEEYTMEYETAPDGNIHQLCAWKMRKSSEYMYAKEDLAGIDMSSDNDEISAQCRINGVPYYYTAATRNKTDFQVNMISCVVYGGVSPRSIEDRILFATLCRTSAPTDEQIEAVKEKAAQILSDIDLGQWQIDECIVEKQTVGTQTEYNILVNAVPVFNGVPAIRCQQLESLRNKDGYAASQYITDANFNFSANGELLTFMLYTPLDMENLVYENVKTIELDSLLDRAVEVLALTDAYSYSYGSYLQFIDEDVQCNITVSELDYGLSRIKAQDQEGSYYYVPAIALKGDVEYIGTESGKTFYISSEPEILLRLNAIDGSVINSTNE